MNKSFYERILDLRNRISLDGDDTIYEEDHLLLDEVLDLIEYIGDENADIEAQIYDYNNTVDIYNELEIGIRLKKQEKLLELYRELMIVKDELMSFLFIGSYNEDAEKLEANLEKQIKELENE